MATLQVIINELHTVLQSIYGEHSIRLWQHSSPQLHPIRYQVCINFPSPYDDIEIRILVTLPSTYPVSSPPQLQLMSKYIGPFGTDPQLFGSILRTYMSTNGVEWSADTVCVFDGLQDVLERCVGWYEEKLSVDKVETLVSEDKKVIQTQGIPEDIEIIEAEAITDRKSAFVGRVCRISHPSQVPLILSHLMADRRVSRAAHPIINAWRCQLGNLLHQDNDDDGETAAGGRLAHLLQILEVDNVLVIVTRYFGGIHLGPDRFKHINQAARNALELGGFLDGADVKKHSGRGKKR